MRVWGFTFVAAAVALALSAPAQAKSLRTAPASAAFADASLWCEFVNTGPTAVITLEARNYLGALVDSVGPTQYLTGETRSWAPNAGAAYCKFDIVAGSSKRIRAQAAYHDKVTGYQMIAVPAR